MLDSTKYHPSINANSNTAFPLIYIKKKNEGEENIQKRKNEGEEKLCGRMMVEREKVTYRNAKISNSPTHIIKVCRDRAF